MGILSTVTIIFVVLKILGLITWGWSLVFSPMLIDILVILITFCILIRKRK